MTALSKGCTPGEICHLVLARCTAAQALSCFASCHESSRYREARCAIGKQGASDRGHGSSKWHWGNPHHLPVPTARRPRWSLAPHCAAFYSRQFVELKIYQTAADAQTGVGLHTARHAGAAARSSVHRVQPSGLLPGLRQCRCRSNLPVRTRRTLPAAGRGEELIMRYRRELKLTGGAQ